MEREQLVARVRPQPTAKCHGLPANAMDCQAGAEYYFSLPAACSSAMICLRRIYTADPAHCAAVANRGGTAGI
jgi:hypothetical protein